MGGLIVRSYLAGFNISTNTFSPPLQPGIRKLVLIGTPNFGSDWANAFTDLAGIQVSEMMPGGSFVWGLGTWNQQSDDLRGIDTIAIAGSVVGGTQNGVPGDGVVTVTSASLRFAFTDGDQRTRVIPYCHSTDLALDPLVSCGLGYIAFVSDRSHPTYQMIRSFLDGNSAWQSIGRPASQASPYSADLLFRVRTSNDQPAIIGPPTWQSTLGPIPFAPSPAFPDLWLADVTPSSSLSVAFTWQGQNFLATIPALAGGTIISTDKFGPVISTRGIVSSAGIPPGALSVAADSLISIYGSNLASSTASSPYPWPSQLAGTTVTIDDFACLLNYAGPTQVNALVPASLIPGLHTLTLQNPQGQHTVTLMIEPTVPTLFSSAGYAAALHSNYQPVSTSNPASVGETISLFATGLGAVSLNNGLETANAIPSVFINGVSSVVTFAGRAPGYQGLDQINVRVPAGIPSGTTIPVLVASGNRTSNQVLLAVK
jgi:uncharacterized protein (TIGR03437 family)